MIGRINCQLIGFALFALLICNLNNLYSQNDAVAWFNRGTRAQANQEKITCYSKAIELNPKFIEAYYNLGYIYKNQGDFINAEKAFRQALLSDPNKLNDEDKLRITYELGITLKKLIRYNEALETLESAKNIANQKEISAAILYELGRTKLLIGNFSGALSDFNQGLQLGSSKQAEFETATENARTLQDIDNKYLVGINHFNSQQYDEAINALTTVIKLSPNYKNSLQKLEEAKRLKNQQIQIDNLSNIYARGIGYMQRKDWENAIIAFKQIEQIDSNYKDVKAKITESQTNLNNSLKQGIYEEIYADGLSDYQKGNWTSAIEAFEKVRDWNQNYKNIEQLYRDAQNRLYQEGVNLVKSRYYTQGKAYLNSKNWESAITNFKKLKNIDSNYRDVQFLLQQAQQGLENEARVDQLEKYYAEGIKHFANGAWLKSILAFERIQQIDLNYKDVIEKLMAAQNNIDNAQVAEASENIIKSDLNQKHESSNWIFVGGIALSAILIPLGFTFFFAPITRAKCLLILGYYQKAALIYESILIKKPNKAKLYPSLAHVYLSLNRNDKTARKIYEIALQMKINPQLRQRLDEMGNQKFLNQHESNNAESLEERLKKELKNLKGI